MNTANARQNRFLALWGMVAALCAFPSLASAEDLVWATGKVLDKRGRPLANAVVAVYDDSNKVIDYAETDAYGEYALAVPRRLLHMDKKRKGFFTEVFGGLTRFIGGASDFINNPVRAGVRALTSSQAASALNPVSGAAITAGGVVADQVLFRLKNTEPKTTLVEERKRPGNLMLKVVGPNSQDLMGVAKVYWVQQETFKAGGKQSRTLAAWVDPIKMEHLESDDPSKAESDYLRILAGRITPSIAEAGQKVKVVVLMPLPPAPTVYVTVVARNSRTGQKWELTPIGGDRYECEIEVDKRFPKDDQVISVIAYAAEQQKPGRREEVERSIEGAGLWNPKDPFRYDPLLVVSRNRADLNLTILVPRRSR